jgi:nitroreductase
VVSCIFELKLPIMIAQLIRNRRSVFPDQYNNKPISRATVEQLLEAANWAPTHKKTQPWRFKVLQASSARENLGVFLRETYLQTNPKPQQFTANKLYNNPVKSAAVIAICMQRDPNEGLPEWEEVAAVAMAVQNMWLVCTEMGIGAYWSSPGIISKMGDFFELQPGERCLGFFYMGYFDETPPDSSRGLVSDKTTWI